MIEQWMSDELRELTPRLTGQQWAGVVKIIQAELDGKTLTSLLLSPERPCAKSTYYGRWARGRKTKKSQPGWVDNPYFTEALDLARRDYRSWLMEQGTAEAMKVLSRAAAPSARELERQVVGDSGAVEVLSQQLDRAIMREDELQVESLARALGTTQLTAALPPLVRALEHDWGSDVRIALIEAVGSIASPLNVDRQKAGMDVLDRAGEATVSKRPEGAASSSTAVFVLPDNKRGDRVLDDGESDG